MKKHILTTMQRESGLVQNNSTSQSTFVGGKQNNQGADSIETNKYRRCIQQFLLLALCLGIVCCQSDHRPHVTKLSQSSTKQVKKQTGSELISIGDTVEIFVLEDQEFNGVYLVREKGDVIFPKIGRIPIAGQTVEEAQKKIRDLLQSSQLQNASVIVDRTHKADAPRNFEDAPKMLIYLTGKVNRPGQHMIALTRQENVCAYEAVLIAGGVAPFADEKHSYILRRGTSDSKQKIPLDLRAIRQGTQDDKPLAEGDMICVPERRFAF